MSITDDLMALAVPDPEPAPDRSPDTHDRHDKLVFVAASALLVVCVVLGGLWLSGLRWRTVTTPSMARTAPVGTVLITEPAKGKTLHVGEFIVFQPPTAPKTSYAHRIYSIATDGSIRTKGDLNEQPDPWTLHATDVQARVVFRFFGLGWLVKALPILLFGLLAVVLACHHWLRRSQRLPAEMVLGSLVVALTLFWLKPLVRADVLTMKVNSGTGQASLVGTGLLPVQVHAPGAHSVVLAPGQRGVLENFRISPNGQFQIHISPHLTGWLWVLLILCWLLPLLVLMAVGIGPREPAAAHRSLAD